MSDALLSRTVVPVAGPDDARATCEVALPHVKEAGGTLTAVYVVEKAGGAIDKASVEQREEFAQEAFDVVIAACEDMEVDCETEIRYDTDVVAAIVRAATDHDASAIVFTPRQESGWADLLSGNLSAKLVKRADRPVIAFPPEDDQ